MKYQLQLVCKNISKDILQTIIVQEDQLTDETRFADELLHSDVLLHDEDCNKLKLPISRSTQWFYQLVLFN